MVQRINNFMIVIAMPRAGGTKFCMDLSEKTGLLRAGEMDPRIITELNLNEFSLKKTAHETKSDESWTIDQYLEIVDNKENYVIHCSTIHWSLLPIADVFLFRKNFKNCLLSMTNFLLRWHTTNPGGDDSIMVSRILSDVIPGITQNCYIAVSYAVKHNITPVWYEDYYDNKPCLTPFVDSNRANEQIMTVCDRWIRQTGIQRKIDLLLTN